MKSGETMLRKIGCAAAVAAMVAVAGCSDSIDVGEGRLFPSTASCSADETRQGDECVPAVHPCTTLHRVVLADGSCGGCRDGFALLNDQCVESVPPAGGSVEPMQPGLPGSPDGAVPETEPQPGMAGGGDEETDTAENGGGGTTTPAQGTNVTFEPITDDPQTSTPQLTNSYGYSSSWTNLIAGSHGGTETAESSSDWEDGSDLDVLGLGTGSHMAVALSDDGIAVMVKVIVKTQGRTITETKVYYRLLDVRNRKKIGNWEEIPFEQGQLYATPSVAIRPDGSAFVIAVERGDQIDYIKYVRSQSNPPSYSSTGPIFLRDHWASSPKVLSNADGTFGIAWISYAWEPPQRDRGIGERLFHKVKFALLPYNLNANTQLVHRIVNDGRSSTDGECSRAIRRDPRAEREPRLSIVGEDTEDKLEATAVGQDYVLAFRQRKSNVLGIDTIYPCERLAILKPDGTIKGGLWPQAKLYAHFTPAIAGVYAEAENPALLEARRCNDDHLCFDYSAEEWGDFTIPFSTDGSADEEHTPTMVAFHKDQKRYVVLEKNYEFLNEPVAQTA